MRGGWRRHRWRSGMCWAAGILGVDEMENLATLTDLRTRSAAMRKRLDRPIRNTCLLVQGNDRAGSMLVPGEAERVTVTDVTQYAGSTYTNLRMQSDRVERCPPWCCMRAQRAAGRIIR